ncbi:hypothetical protein Y013_08385 [Rhodococcus pyridinivorans SB3094]|uniref:Uncharacterized protein n=1 Tax=Rhodococcus pyridinivorans SB3094 TaxID=1435356 RepID=V9XJP5_9NOCA|nr:hypothetical protein Y013_08385 [Rhodococcus pyridinivorans SB3094]
MLLFAPRPLDGQLGHDTGRDDVVWSASFGLQ